MAVATRLTAVLRPGDTLARLSGDEFVILCEDLIGVGAVEHLAARIDICLSEAFVLPSAEVQISASVGIAFAGSGDRVPEDLLRDADAAMYQAKRQGGGQHGIVDLREQGLSDHRANLSQDLRAAMAKGELWTAYQPIISIADGSIAGAEALLRWTHPTHGPIPPQTAIPIAEQSSLIGAIGGWVLETSFRDRARWQEATQVSYGIAVNVSAHQLMAPEFCAQIHAALAATATDPRLVTLEITESVFLHDSERAVIVLGELKEMGLLLALDDFGTGYSSLSYLKRFPIDILKIDRSFIADLGTDPASRLIIEAIATLGHGLHMTVIAEGVETLAQLDQIQTLGCDYYQGFLSAHPCPANQFHDLITTLKDSHDCREDEPIGPVTP